MQAPLLRSAAAAALLMLAASGCYLRDDYWYPEVTWISPSSGDVGVALDADVRAEFDRRMRPVTFTSETFFVEQGTTRVPGTIELIYDDRIAVFTPASELEPDTLYRVTIRRSVESRYDRRLRHDVVWEFTTGPAPTTLLLANELLVASFRAHALRAGYEPDELPEHPADMSRSAEDIARALSVELVGEGALAHRIASSFLATWQTSLGSSPDPASEVVTAMQLGL